MKLGNVVLAGIALAGMIATFAKKDYDHAGWFAFVLLLSLRLILADRELEQAKESQP